MASLRNFGNVLKMPAGRILAAFILIYFFLLLPNLKTDEYEPLVGGLFVGDLTVSDALLEQGEPLTLDEITRLALLRNLDMKTAKLENQAEGYQKAIAESIYDTELVLFANYHRDQQQTANIVLGDRQINGIAGASLEKLLPTGTRIKVEGATERTSTNSAFTTLSRYYQSYGLVAVEQPVLRNAFGYLDRKRIQRVKLNIKQFDLLTLDEIAAALSEARLQYWDLKFSFENFRTRRKALRKAQDFYQITRDKLDIGLTEKTDVFAAEANVRKRVLEVLEAEHRLKDASFALKILLNLPEIPLIYPAEDAQFHPVQLNFNEELERAYAVRRDLKRVSLALEDRQIELKMRSNERLPQLDFEGSYASTGLDREMAASQGEIGGFNHPQYFAGVRFSADLENREAEGRFRQVKLYLQSLENEVLKTRLNIAKEMDSCYRQLLLASEQVRHTGEIEKLQQNKLLEEEKNFNRGRSSSKMIIDYQEDLFEAEIQAVQALVHYKKSLENFYLISNQLLEKSGVSQVSSGQRLDLPEIPL